MISQRRIAALLLLLYASACCEAAIRGIKTAEGIGLVAAPIAGHDDGRKLQPDIQEVHIPRLFAHTVMAAGSEGGGGARNASAAASGKHFLLCNSDPAVRPVYFQLTTSKMYHTH